MCESKDNKDNRARKNENTNNNNKGKSSGDTSNRGLASADEETKERVAREGGKASPSGGRKIK